MSMNQSFVPNIEFLAERSFETKSNEFKIKAERLFGRLFGDPEHIPLSFTLELNGVEREVTKDKMDNISGQIIITYIEPVSKTYIFIYL